MTLAQGYRSVIVDADRSRDVMAVDEWAFAITHPTGVPELIDATIDWSRCKGIECDGSGAAPEGELAAVHASFGYTMRVQGGTIPTSGLTWVGVHPAHRRRGLLTTMIDDHFAASLARGEAVSTLIAAETAIYQRFGYGLACPSVKVTLPSPSGLRPVEGADALRVRLEDASLERHARVVRAVLARDQRPGTIVACGDEMLADQFIDPEPWREGQERKRIAIVEDDHGPAAFAILQRKLAWTNNKPDGTGSTRTWASATDAASHRLWSVLGDFDLISSFTVNSMALDDPLLHLTKDIRGLDLQLRDQIWLRILDVPAALTARTYSADIDLVIEVTDAQLPSNARAWRLVVKDGAASVVPAVEGASADLAMSVQELSTVYLGGPTVDALAAAGLVRELTPGAVARASDAFRSRLAPRSSFHF